MQPLKILQVTIEEWILVIPFYFKGKLEPPEFLDVIDLVRNRLPLNAVYNFANFKDKFVPSGSVEGVTHSLRTLSFTASRSNDFCNRNRKIQECSLKFSERFGKVHFQYCGCVRLTLNLKVSSYKLIKHSISPF